MIIKITEEYFDSHKHSKEMSEWYFDIEGTEGITKEGFEQEFNATAQDLIDDDLLTNGIYTVMEELVDRDYLKSAELYIFQPEQFTVEWH